MEEEKYSRSFVIKTAAIVMSITGIVSILLSMLVWSSRFKGIYSEFDKIYAVDSVIKKNFYQDYDESDLINNACRGMVAGLGDVYSAFYTDDDYQNLMSSISSEYVGIGIAVAETDEGYLEIKEVTEGSPAEVAGLMQGDIITYIDGVSVSGVGADEALKLIKSGEAGQKAVFTVVRGEQSIDISATLDNIQEISVYYSMIEGNVAYIRVSAFRENTGDTFRDILKQATDEGAMGVILDLRNNLGGESVSAETVADAFLDKSVMYYSMDKSGEKEYVYAKKGSNKLPMAVLVNGRSASASELVCGALKENGRAFVIGETTYGKGLIQGLYSIGDKSLVKVTVAEYFTPDGNKVNGIGVAPDMEVLLNEGAVIGDVYSDNQLAEALNYIIAQINSAEQ